MQNANHILLASHGTEGAQAAEQIAIQMCNEGGHVHHLIVVPSFWQGMTGDDWLNNGSTRDRFRRYLEDQLAQEVQEHQARVSEAAEAKQVTYTTEVVLGEPDEVLVSTSQKEDFDLVVLGSPRPKGKSGLSSRMVTEATRELPVPVMICLLYTSDAADE